ncbi:MAG: cytochrome c oxidase assembly protein [Actinobacteria bacterium]|nr:cytochrome c oxidase assembly protein [Actinomycetota bacterium]
MTSGLATGRALVAHAGQPPLPHDLWGAWPFEPLVVVGLAVAVWLYVVGYGRIRSQPPGRRAVPRWRAWCFGGAVAALTVALLTPLGPLGEALFGAHMGQHLLLTIVAAPLLVLGRPIVVGSLALPPRWRHRVNRVRRAFTPDDRGTTLLAFLVVLAYVGTWWMWHIPALYAEALENTLVHAAEHAMMLGSGVAFWWLVADARGRHANAAGVIAVFAVVIASSTLAGLLTFGTDAWFPQHGPVAEAWGLTPMEDQELAGGLMWFPGGLAYMVAGAVLFARWLRADQRGSQLRWEPRAP